MREIDLGGRQAPCEVSPVADSLRTSFKGPGSANEFSCPSFARLLARLEGVEPPARGFEGRCSIQLSYRRVQAIVPCARVSSGPAVGGPFALTDPDA